MAKERETLLAIFANSYLIDRRKVRNSTDDTRLRVQAG